MALFQPDQPRLWQRPRFVPSKITGSFTTGVFGDSGTLVTNTSVFYRLYYGATYADLGKDLSGYAQEGGTGTTHATAATLTRNQHSLGAALLVASDATGRVFVEQVTVA